MYVGRILSIGMNNTGKPFVAYRVSSRSFPNRQAKVFDKNKAAIIPKEGHEKDIFENTYITYNCIKIVKDIAIVSNGSHTDVIADKIYVGMNIKDAIAYSLLTMDYEKDDYNTPRIAGVVTSTNNKDDYQCYIGIATNKKILVEEVPYGKAAYISTYGSVVPNIVDFEANDSEEVALFIFDGGKFADFDKPVTSAGALFDGEWTIKAVNP
ncbi:IMP cyclohydrolase [Methanobrevibacter sp. DSM 116169]|uniref:IMP cyclohydrolase n=1 Tax=Methanobrevibacter sp. DSM 116169 TaxID=3242727 RepID=UPI0038FC79FA